MEYTVRHATAVDLDRINEIYNQYIVDRHTSFDLEPWPIEERVEWFKRYRNAGRYQVLVAESDGRVVGFAASSPFRDKAGYATSVETTVVLDNGVLGRGLGGRLLVALLERLELEDIHRVYALIALPNEASIALHERLGYRTIGVLDEVGSKLGSFHSVVIMELHI